MPDNPRPPSVLEIILRFFIGPAPAPFDQVQAEGKDQPHREKDQEQVLCFTTDAVNVQWVDSNTSESGSWQGDMKVSPEIYYLNEAAYG